MKKLVMGIMIIGLILPFFFGNIKISANINTTGTTGNIIPNYTIFDAYDSSSTLIINLDNLTRNNDYGILIGANIQSKSREWFNFTASAQIMQIRTNHIGEPSSNSYLDPDAPIAFHPNTELLLLHLYGIASLEDSEPIFLDSFWYQIRHLEGNPNPDLTPSILAGIILIGSVTGIFLTIFKYIKN